LKYNLQRKLEPNNVWDEETNSRWSGNTKSPSPVHPNYRPEERPPGPNHGSTPPTQKVPPTCPGPYGKPPSFEGVPPSLGLGEAGRGLAPPGLSTLIYKKRQSAREWKCCMWGTHLGEFPCSIHFFETRFARKNVRELGNYSKCGNKFVNHEQIICGNEIYFPK